MNDRKEQLAALRAAAMRERDPTASDDVLAVLLNEVRERPAARILEIGAGRGLTSVALLLHSAAHAVGIERDPQRCIAARANFCAFDLNDRATLFEGEAAEILPMLEGPFDIIFLDAAKVQYRRFLPECRRLLAVGGVLFADDVLLFADGVPPKRKMLARHIEEFLEDLFADGGFSAQILRVGKGLAVARRIGDVDV